MWRVPLPTHPLRQTIAIQGRNFAGDDPANCEGRTEFRDSAARFSAVELPQPDAPADTDDARVCVGVFPLWVTRVSSGAGMSDQLAAAESRHGAVACATGVELSGFRRRDRTIL